MNQIEPKRSATMLEESKRPRLVAAGRTLVESAPHFEAMRRWRPWHDLPGLIPFLSGVALWIVLALGVAVPLGDALARLHPGAGAAPAIDCRQTLDDAFVAYSQPCVMAAPGG